MISQITQNVLVAKLIVPFALIKPIAKSAYKIDKNHYVSVPMVIMKT